MSFKGRRFHLVRVGMIVCVLGTILPAACGRPVRDLVDAALDGIVPDSNADAQVPTGSGIDSHAGSRISTRRDVYDGADGSRLDTGSTVLFDTQRNEECSLERMTDLALHCVPKASASASPGLFADAACAVPVVTFAWGQCASSVPTYASYRSSACPPTPSALQLYQVGAEVTGTIYSNQSGACSSITRLQVYKYYVRGAELLPGLFVQFSSTP